MLLKDVDFLESLLGVKFPKLREGLELYHSKLIFSSDWCLKTRALFLVDHDLSGLVNTLSNKGYTFVMHDISLLNRSYHSCFGGYLLKSSHLSVLTDYCLH